MSRQLKTPILILVVIVVLLAAATLSEGRKSRCSQARDLQLDDEAARMGFLGDHSFRVPQNGSKMAEFCSQLKQSVGSIQSYTRDCLQGFTRQILTTLMKRGKQQQSTICQSDASKQEFMNRLSCLRQPGDIATFHKVMDASVARYEFIASKAVQGELKLPALCCSYQIFHHDLEATLKRLCGPNQAETNKYVQKIVTATTSEFHNLICEDHRSMDDCRTSTKTRDSLKQLEDVTAKVKGGKLSPRGKSLIPPMLDILDASS